MAAGKQDHPVLLSANRNCIVVFFIIFQLLEFTVHAQVQVTGHVFAEIVEPTALTAKANNDHYIKSANYSVTNEIVLAEVILRGDINTNIDVAVTTGNLVAANGDIFPMEAFACPECCESNQYTTAGDKLFTLKAIPGDNIRNKENNTYNGQYSVVFMYN